MAADEVLWEAFPSGGPERSRPLDSMTPNYLEVDGTCDVLWGYLHNSLKSYPVMTNTSLFYC